MRLWSLHPGYLDSKGLVAAWREALLAQAVLQGKTRGYRSHPQLERFQAAANPVGTLNAYLQALYEESVERGYNFDVSKIGPSTDTVLSVTTGQLEFELTHLLRKIELRSPANLHRLPQSGSIRPHPLFEVRDGPVEPWERGAL